MTAQGSSDVTKEGVACHIYNFSPKGKKLFSDTEDYETFINFLGEYLTPPDTDNKTKEFTVKGKVYKGVPHQPKNYANTISLLAYSLTPDKFDLIVKYSDKDNLQRFMRSLSTRYSIYFHKKYPGTGSVFKDSYISEDIKEDINLLNLSRDLHKNIDMSSYQEYLGIRQTNWINTNLILNLHKNAEKGEYKDFVTAAKEEGQKHVYEDNVVNQKVTEETKQKAKIEDQKDTVKTAQEYITVTTGPGFREVFVAGSVFLVLLTFGFKNVYTNSYTSGQAVSQYTAVLSEQTEVSPAPQPVKETPVPVSTPAADLNIDRGFARVTIDKGLSITADIYSEASSSSKIIDEAFDGEIFEIVSETDQVWSEIKLNDALNGFILNKYIEIYQNE